jgi:hypothetical protein
MLYAIYTSSLLIPGRPGPVSPFPKYSKQGCTQGGAATRRECDTSLKNSKSAIKWSGPRPGGLALRLRDSWRTEVRGWSSLALGGVRRGLIFFIKLNGACAPPPAPPLPPPSPPPPRPHLELLVRATLKSVIGLCGLIASRPFSAPPTCNLHPDDRQLRFFFRRCSYSTILRGWTCQPRIPAGRPPCPTAPFSTYSYLLIAHHHPSRSPLTV